jgi:hypothetical protein
MSISTDLALCDADVRTQIRQCFVQSTEIFRTLFVISHLMPVLLLQLSDEPDQRVAKLSALFDQSLDFLDFLGHLVCAL